ncbi:SDR family NAD(P)-dependent oxidoreductase [Rhodopirellula sp. SWK7]|uniref:SDR family NAD(P)-dependent oxidoreductase n=1 Tax=Rhodopirellula sp. SWK7 TaxID=595460 RepID=UPI0002BF2C1C|nr:SDR family NAD(P)-dependent oxidoreductase [Rhodopirellula sp. SWK7]EMI43739.1 short-chain dehydrogenase/reductase SDR [Rhodopirellula sp. SWK7]
MKKRILITGATSGIGFETAKSLLSLGHHVILHGRTAEKIANAVSDIGTPTNGGSVETIAADLSHLSDVEKLAVEVLERCDHLDVMINNAGIYKTSQTIASDGIDVRLVVNTIAPYWLTRRLLPLMNGDGRVVNVSSAAQAPVNLAAFSEPVPLDHNAAYAQSKLALMMWSRELATTLGENQPLVVSVNPGSLLATKMVNETFGIPGSDVMIGADILTRAAISDEFADASGKYYDNDSKRFGTPHPDGLDSHLSREVIEAMDAFLASKGIAIAKVSA